MSVCETALVMGNCLCGSVKDDQWEEDQRNSAVLLTSCIFNVASIFDGPRGLTDIVASADRCSLTSLGKLLEL